MEYKIRIIFLFFMIHTIGITSPSSKSTQTSCPDNTIRIAKSNMLQGIDITKFNVLNDEHYRNNVLNLSCETSWFWSDVEHLPNRKFTIPDQIARITVNVSNHLHSPQVHFAHDMIDLQNIFLSMSDLQTDNLIGACSQNTDYNKYIRSYFHDNVTFALVTSQLSLYSIQFKPPSELLLDSEFEDKIAKLPVKYEQNPTAYQELIEYYGTHYIEGAEMGAVDFLKYSIPKKYYATEKDIADTLKAQFFNELWPWGHVTEEQKKKPKNFIQICQDLHCDNSNGAIMWELGNFTDDMFDWFGIINYVLRPLEDLILDENMKAKMRTASEMYRIGAYLGELKAVYDAAQKYYQPSDKDRVLLNKVEAFVNSNISTSTSINAEQAIQMIDDLYNKVKDKSHLDQLITDYHVTARLKLQFAQSICDRSAGLCPSRSIQTENDQFEKLYSEYQLRKADGKRFTREMYHQFERKVRVLASSYGMHDDLHRGLGASCEKCS